MQCSTGLCDIIKKHLFQESFVENYEGLEIIADAGTVIGYDGGQPVATPYDDCVLIMPSKRLRPGQTAVRFGRLVG